MATQGGLSGLCHSLDVCGPGSVSQLVELTLTSVSWLCEDGRSPEVGFAHG